MMYCQDHPPPYVETNKLRTSVTSVSSQCMQLSAIAVLQMLEKET